MSRTDCMPRESDSTVSISAIGTNPIQSHQFADTRPGHAINKVVLPVFLDATQYVIKSVVYKGSPGDENYIRLLDQITGHRIPIPDWHPIFRALDVLLVEVGDQNGLLSESIDQGCSNGWIQTDETYVYFPPHFLNMSGYCFGAVLGLFISVMDCLFDKV